MDADHLRKQKFAKSSSRTGVHLQNQRAHIDKQAEKGRSGTNAKDVFNVRGMLRLERVALVELKL